VRGSTVTVIVAGDFNAHSLNWGSQLDDAVGRMIDEATSSMNLLLCNHGEHQLLIGEPEKAILI